MSLKYIVIYTILLSQGIIFASSNVKKASSHAPIGVMGDHNHNKGEWMFSYRFQKMKMGGNRTGTSNVSESQVLSKFKVTPQDMDMDMHMFGSMYGLSNKLTLMLMIGYMDMSMNHKKRTGDTFKVKTNGIGDLKLSGLYSLWENKRKKLILNFGLSLPTGSVTKTRTTNHGKHKIPYPMQIGSGTYDPFLRLTLNSNEGTWSWGAQLNSLLRLGNNSEDYRLGNRIGFTAWISKDLAQSFSTSLRISGQRWGNIRNQDKELHPMMIPTARRDLRGGQSLDALIGINYIQTNGFLEGHRLALEFSLPVYQKLDGPQLKIKNALTLGWQYSF